jgi:hypothetical protein
MWEIFSGIFPYASMDNVDVLPFLKGGKRLERPLECPMELYEMWLLSWDLDPEKRPSFQMICDKIEQLSGNSGTTLSVKISDTQTGFYH